jgi:hypothetical protein
MRKISRPSDDDNNNKDGQIQINYWIWLILYVGIGLVISFIFPFPISLVFALLIFILLNAIRTDIALRRQGVGGIKGLHKSMSSSFGGGNNSRFGGARFGYSPIKFYCMNCGHEHRKDICPKCGSKAVRVG